MSVKINIPDYLSYLANDQDVFEIQGSTVGQCLEQLVAKYPGLRDWLFGKDGNLRRTVDVYVNMESTYPEELAKPVKDGDELHIIIIISGG